MAAAASSRASTTGGATASTGASRTSPTSTSSSTSTRVRSGMPKVHCEVFAGFIFVNLAQQDPVPLRTFLGERILELEAYPFDRMTQRYGFSTRIHGNWKLAVDSVCEWYHPPYVHGRFIDPDVAKAEKMVPPVDAYHYDLFPPHMLTSVPGAPPLPPREPGTAGPAGQDQNWVYRLFRAGIFGPDDVPDLGPRPEFLNKGGIKSWGNDTSGSSRTCRIQIWNRGYYITYTYWPEAVDSHIYEIDLYFAPPANAHERLGQELTVDSTIEFAMQDVNTIEATHSGALDPSSTAVQPERPGAAHPPVPQAHPRHRRRPSGERNGPGGVISMSTTTRTLARRLRRPRAVRRRLGQADTRGTLRPAAVHTLRRDRGVLRRHRTARRGSHRVPRHARHRRRCPTTQQHCCSCSTR